MNILRVFNHNLLFFKSLTSPEPVVSGHLVNNSADVGLLNSQVLKQFVVFFISSKGFL